MFHGAAKTEPCGQRDAPRILRRQIAEIESDHSKASAFEQQIRDPQKLFQAMLGECEFSPQRTQNSRSNSIPAAAADFGSRASLASTTAQNSPRRVAAASADNMNVLRPEEAGPQISVRQPRGRPPVGASISAIPLETISGAGRMANREAGVTSASRASLKAAGKRLAGVDAPRQKARPPKVVGKLRLQFRYQIQKGGLGRRSGKHCGRHKILGNFRERRSREVRRQFRFLFALRIVRLRVELSSYYLATS